MRTLDTQNQIGRLVAERPARSRVFESYGIDYCCGGKRTLAEACERKGIDATRVLEDLVAIEEVGTADVENPKEMSLTALADHIEATHHVYLRRELPRLDRMVDKVFTVHGETHEWLADVKTTFADLVAELMPHMMKEEQILFPMIREIDRGGDSRQTPFGSVNNPIRAMEKEHANAGEALLRLRTITNGYTPPEGACNTFRAMLDGLSELEADTHEHIHKENNILFPRASLAEQGGVN